MIPGIVAGAPFSGVLWTPALLSPVLWLNDDSSVTDAGGGACSQWNDISGNARHFTQGTSSRRPTIVASSQASRRTISFDGSDDVLDGTSGCAGLTQNKSQFAVWLVANPTVRTTTTVARIYNFSIGLAANTSARAQLTSVNSNFRLSQRRLDADAVSNNDISHASKAWRIHNTMHNWGSAQSIIRLNGGTATTVNTGQGSGNTSNTASTAVEIGGTTSTTGQNTIAEFGELVCLESIPSDADRQRMEGYLAWRWDLVSLLPNDHPYKSSPPYE